MVVDKLKFQEQVAMKIKREVESELTKISKDHFSNLHSLQIQEH